ncbi:MAG TPA: ATP-binding protein [Terriglobia bacterium]|nr:ATP-binding protein [Terriglobia bacterium]
MSAPSILERLSAHKALGLAPKAEIEWVAAHGTLNHFAAGAVLSAQEAADAVQVVLSGHLAIYRDRDGARRKTTDWFAGDVTGTMPYSRIKEPPGEVLAEEATDVFTIDRQVLPEMIRECPVWTETLVHMMLDRARLFKSRDLQDEKLMSLGKLSAGLAHELNNPASAIARSAASMSAAMERADVAARALGSAGLSGAQLSVIDRAREECLGNLPILSPLEQEEREDSIAAWLRAHKVDPEIAEALAETGVTFEMLDRLAESMSDDTLAASLQWIATRCATKHLTREIQESATRIYDLVRAVKGFTQMDRATVPEPVDIAQGLDNTLMVLRSKAKGTSASVKLHVEKDLPRVRGFAGEINQVWVNLIDNALDAAGEAGRVEINASRRGNSVVVQVIDNGPGVPEEIREKIFEPFFSTKAVGQGTGLGLDIARRLVEGNGGWIDLESKPGRTEFRVTFPISRGRAGEAE